MRGLELLMGITNCVNPDNVLIFIDSKNDAILLENEMTKSWIFFRARAAMRAPAQ
jgi:hypothetical protein